MIVPPDNNIIKSIFLGVKTKKYRFEVFLKFKAIFLFYIFLWYLFVKILT